MKNQILKKYRKQALKHEQDLLKILKDFNAGKMNSETFKIMTANLQKIVENDRKALHKEIDNASSN